MRRIPMSIVSLLFAVQCLLSGPACPAAAQDWPMWRYDAGRTASSPHALPEQLYLLWHRRFPKPVPAWEDTLNRDLMPFDRVYEPIVAGKDLFLSVTHNNAVLALDTDSGRERWAHYADGPVRLPPVAVDDRVVFASDDGRLYCLDAGTGKPVWTFQGGPSDRRILGNGRLISTWPARGGPVVRDGTVYFAAGIWPFMGTFIHALNVTSGRVEWTNDGSGSLYMLQPHNSPAYGGVGPQGAMAVADGRLLIPGGRSVPACYDLSTGEYLYYHLARYNKTGGAFVAARDSLVFNYYRDGVTSLYRLSDGERLIARIGGIPVLADGFCYQQGDSTTALPVDSLRIQTYERDILDRKTGEARKVQATRWVMNPLWRLGVDSRNDLIKSGNRLYAAGMHEVTAIDVAEPGRPVVAWRRPIDGTPSRLVAADGKLFVVTLEGDVLAFGARSVLPVGTLDRAASRAAEAVATAASGLLQSTIRNVTPGGRLARHLVDRTGVTDGYCLVYADGDDRLPEALAARSDLHVIAVLSDADAVRSLRDRLRSRGVSGSRISVFQGRPGAFNTPPYLASLTVVRNPASLAPSDIARLYTSVRPYGGVLALVSGPDDAARLKRAARSADLANAEVRNDAGRVLIARQGALPGAADWTHQYGDAANTIKSDDKRVRLPLGLLWFGGIGNEDVLPRHGHGPPEQVMGGRLFIQGINRFSARDVYTGRQLWKRDIPDAGTFGLYYDETYAETPLSTAYNQVHIPGANARGTNFVVTPDRVYIAQTDDCLVLDPATGKTLGRIPLPGPRDSSFVPRWGYIGVLHRYLVAGSGAVDYTRHLEVPGGRRARFHDLDVTSSRSLVVMNRYTGAPLWSRESELGFRHNAIVAGRGRLFCIDVLPKPVQEAMQRRGLEPQGRPSLQALDLTTGDVLWRTTEGVFGTWLGYSKEHDVLLQAGRPSRDMVIGETGRGMTAYDASTGKVLWTNDAAYAGPCILHGDAIITDRYAYDLLTGEQITREDPLTGNEAAWAYSRRYGCNYAIASEFLLTFRSAAAGYYDLADDGGTGNFGGFKSGCTSNLIAANGVLNAPDYTRTCTCSYQNQTSLALVHDPDVDVWVTYFREADAGPIRQVGVNLGAPGNRRAPDGRFWVAHPLLPLVSKPEKESGIDVGIEVSHGPGAFYTHHTSRVKGDLSWVAASGCRGIEKVEVDLRRTGPAVCDADLLFAEPDNDEPGRRVFDVLAEGRPVLNGFDIAAEAGGRWRSVTVRVPGVKVTDGRFTLTFRRHGDGPGTPETLPLLCGVGIVVRQA